MYFASSPGIGLTTHLTEYVIGVKRTGNTVIALYSNKMQEKGLTERLQREHIESAALHNLESLAPARFFTNALKVAKLIDRYGIEIIQCQGLIHVLLAYLARLLANAHPIIVTYFHAFPSDTEMIRKVTLSVMTKCADMILPVSRQTRDLLTGYGVPRGKLTVVYNTLNYRLFNEIEERPLTQSAQEILHKIKQRTFIVYAAQLVDRKDHETLLRAMQCVLESHQLTLVITHDGSLRNRLKELANNLGIARNVIFAGRVEEYESIIQLMARQCFGVVTSKAETFCHAIIEPMALGKPVITSPVGIAEEVVVEGETGYLFQISDYSMLAERIEHLLDNPQEVLRMGQNAQALVANKFSVERISKCLVGIYAGLLRI